MLELVFGRKGKKKFLVVEDEPDKAALTPVEPYNYNWKERKTDLFQSGAEDNLWWYSFRKSLKEQEIIHEIKLTVQFPLELI